jgi:hypothetical protein
MVQVAARYQTRVITRFQLERDRLGAILPRSNCVSESADEMNASRTSLHRAVRQTNGCRPRTRHDGDEGKAQGIKLASVSSLDIRLMEPDRAYCLAALARHPRG